MARYWFGGDIPSFVITPDPSTHAVSVVPGSVVTFWDSQNGGTQLVDLLDASNNPASSVTADANGAIPLVQGPDGIGVMWAQADASTTTRRKLYGDLAGTIIQAALDAAAANSGLQSAPYIVPQAVDGSWPATRPATARQVWAIGTTIPAWLAPLDVFLQTSALLT